MNPFCIHVVTALLMALNLVTSVCSAHESNIISSKIPPNFADIVEPLLPSVVNISTTTDLKGDRRLESLSPQGITMDDLLRFYLEENSPGPVIRSRKSTSLGSGFIVAQQGDTAYVVTCAHVINDVDEIKITLNDDVTSFKGEVVGKDKRTDLALLKMKTTKKLVPITWGNSNNVRIGEHIIVIGNAFGLSSTVTVGIASTISRDIGRDPVAQLADYVQGYIQTDAPINVGNSGGPMFNIDGQVIAISRVIFSPNGGSIGLGFGIPSAQAQLVVEQLRKFGRTQRGWIGIHIRRFTSEDAESLDLKSNAGAFIDDVTQGGPAAQAGIQSGDLVINYDQEKVKDSRHLQYLVGDAAIGSVHKLTVWRAGKQIFISIKIAEFEKAEELGLVGLNPTDQNQSPPGDRIIGMVLKAVTPELIEQYKLTTPGGLYVEFVDPNSEAESKGITRGIVITEAISGQTTVKLSTVADVKKLIAKAIKDHKKNIMIQIQDGTSKTYMSLGLK